MVRRLKSTLSHLLRVHTGRRQLAAKIGLSKAPVRFVRRTQSEGFADATSHSRLVCEARQGPLDEWILERRPGLDDRKVVASGECPIFELLTSSTALVYVRVRSRRRHDGIRETLRDNYRSLYRTVWRVLLKPSLQRLVRTDR